MQGNNYSFYVAWSDGDNGYIATCPEFPGLSAFGETADDALSEAKVALELFIEDYSEEGKALPKPNKRQQYSGQFRLRLPKSLHARLAEQAENDGVSLNTLAITCISDYLARLSVAVASRQSLEKEQEYIDDWEDQTEFAVHERRVTAAAGGYATEGYIMAGAGSSHTRTRL
jgi:predicted RNase H-like HicB family nuclease